MIHGHPSEEQWLYAGKCECGAELWVMDNDAEWKGGLEDCPHRLVRREDETRIPED